MTPALRIADLRFRYSPDAPWATRVRTLDLAPGEQVLLTGGSGSGKSTLLQLIAGLLDPTEGAVELSGEPIHKLRGAARDRFRGRRIGFIFQVFNLLQGFTAQENVEAALMCSDLPRAEHASRARSLLERLGIDRPWALADRLSIGQQQRVAVARAVAGSPALVLADEPTASLDPQNASNAIELIKGVCRESNAALLCVSHDPSLSAHFERRVRLEELA